MSFTQYLVVVLQVLCYTTCISKDFIFKFRELSKVSLIWISFDNAHTLCKWYSVIFLAWFDFIDAFTQFILILQ